MKITIILIIAFCSFYINASSQQGELADSSATTQIKTGRPMPDFMLRDIYNFRSKNARLNDFKGKWLMLDLWAVTCATCIKKMPELDTIQRHLKDNLQILLIGDNGMGVGETGKRIIPLYEKLQKRYNLTLASAFDSTLFQKWQIFGVPRIIVIDPEGIVRVDSRGTDINEKTIKSLIEGHPVEFSKFGVGGYTPYDVSTLSDVPTFTGSQNGSLIYRSILTKGNGELTVIDMPREWGNETPKNGFRVIMMPLSRLYQMAYFAEFDWLELKKQLIYPYPVLELKDSGMFQYDYASKDFKGLYNYNLTFTRRTSAITEYKLIFQQELKNIFGYNASLETRQMPVWKLVAKPGVGNRLKTKGGKKQVKGFIVGASYLNISTAELADEMASVHQHELPIVDETGIMHNIDITIEGSILDFKDLKLSLEVLGLDLVPGTKEMTVLVLKDPE